MASKKASRDKEVEKPPEDLQPDHSLGNLEAHISQRINQLQTDEGPDALHGGADDSSGGAGHIAPFEPFEGYDFAALHGAAPDYTSSYDKVRDVYQESGEIIKGINGLTDLLTESLLNLNVRLNDMEERLREVSALHGEELHKLRIQVKEVHKAIPAIESSPRTERPDTQKEHGIEAYMNELRKQVSFSKERMDRNIVEMGAKIEERQTAFLNILDTRVKVMEKISLGYKESLNRNFLNLAILLILIVVIAGTLISHSVDNLAAHVSAQLDALTSAVHDTIEAGHQHTNAP